MPWGIALLPLFGFGLILLARAWYRVVSVRYRLTTQRLFVQRGLVARHREEVEQIRGAFREARRREELRTAEFIPS